MGEGVRARLFAQVLADTTRQAKAVPFSWAVGLLDVTWDLVKWPSLLDYSAVLQSPEHVALGHPIVNATHKQGLLALPGLFHCSTLKAKGRSQSRPEGHG